MRDVLEKMWENAGHLLKRNVAWVVLTVMGSMAGSELTVQLGRLLHWAMPELEGTRDGRRCRVRWSADLWDGWRAVPLVPCLLPLLLQARRPLQGRPSVRRAFLSS